MKYADGQGKPLHKPGATSDRRKTRWYRSLQQRFSTFRSKLSLCSRRRRTLPEPPYHLRFRQWTLSRSLRDYLSRQAYITRSNAPSTSNARNSHTNTLWTSYDSCPVNLVRRALISYKTALSAWTETPGPHTINSHRYLKAEFHILVEITGK